MAKRLALIGSQSHIAPLSMLSFFTFSLSTHPQQIWSSIFGTPYSSSVAGCMYKGQAPSGGPPSTAK